MKCRDCEQFISIQNTEETSQGICTAGFSLRPTKLDDECFLLPTKRTCGLCDNFTGYGCSIVSFGDEPCGFFVDERETKILNYFYELRMRGEDIREVANSLVDEVMELKIPKERIK